MEKKDIRIMYGMPIAPVFGYTEARETLFPNCDDYLIGGCIIRENKKNENKYICEQCNTQRKKWKKQHRSEIIFETSINIKDDIILVLNNSTYEIDKLNIYNNNYINCISLPNGNYNINVKNRNTLESIASSEIELKNNFANIIILNNEDNILNIKVECKNRIVALWY